MTSERTRRRRGRLPKGQRELLADRLHLVADGDPTACRNPFARFMSPDLFAALWREHGAAIVERWRETGHQPSSWWRWLAGRAGVTVPKVAA